MLKKIYLELLAIKKELQTIRSSLEPKMLDVDAVSRQIQECSTELIEDLELGQNNSEKPESLQEMAERFNANKIGFICEEALKIYFCTKNEKIAVRALELLERASQY